MLGGPSEQLTETQNLIHRSADAAAEKIGEFMEISPWNFDKAWREIPPGTQDDIVKAWASLIREGANVFTSGIDDAALEGAQRILADCSRRDPLKYAVEAIPGNMKEGFVGILGGLIIAEIMSQREA